MSTNPIRLQYLFEKYINDTCSKQELKEFWQLLTEISENDVIGDNLKDLWNRQQEKVNPAGQVNWDKTYATIMQKARGQEIDYSKYGRIRWLRPAVAAASVCLCLILGWWFIKERTTGSLKSAVTATPVKTAIRHQVINLPDGTTVTLNLGSKLDYPPVFNGTTRDVYLTGEAYFDVVHNPQKPFLVHTGRFVTRVLGTAFDVKSYPDEQQLFVTVSRGKVQVLDDKKILGVLLPDNQLTINKQSGKTDFFKINAEAEVKWKEEDLVFEDVTWGEAAVIISNRFGVQIEFRNEALRNRRFTATFLSRVGIEQVIDVICAATSSAAHKENEKLIWVEENE